MDRRHTLVLIIVIGIHTWMYVIPLSAAETGNFGQFQEQKRAAIKDIFNNLNLTATQQEMIELKQNTVEKRQKEIRDQIRQKRGAIRRELEQDSVDTAKIDLMVNELIELIARRIRARVQGIIEMKSILTKKQFKIFQKETQELKARHPLKRKFY